MEDDGCGRRQAESCPELLLWRWEELILVGAYSFLSPHGPRRPVHCAWLGWTYRCPIHCIPGSALSCLYRPLFSVLKFSTSTFGQQILLTSTLLR